MGIALTLTKIVDYYDVPIIFIAEDAVGTKYMCLSISLDGDAPSYISTPISNGRLSKFFSGKLDLRDIFEFPEIYAWYTFEYHSKSIDANLFDESNLPEDYLPEAGYFFEADINNNDIILQEAVSIGRPVIHLSISDEENRRSINAEHLSVILILYQSFVQNSLRKLVKPKSRADSFNNDIVLRAFDSSPGSFNIHLASEFVPDAFGESTIDHALFKFDEIVNSFNEDTPATHLITFDGRSVETSILSNLRLISGHAVSSYTKLLKRIIDNDLRVVHKWYSPGLGGVHVSKIDRSKAEKMYQFITQTSDLGTEIRHFEGHFSQVDVDRRTWRIRDIHDSKSYHGSASKELLEGIIVEKHEYKIECQEILEENLITMKEVKNYILTRIISD